jgi:hypothetical protein
LCAGKEVKKAIYERERERERECRKRAKFSVFLIFFSKFVLFFTCMLFSLYHGETPPCKAPLWLEFMVRHYGPRGTQRVTFVR